LGLCASISSPTRPEGHWRSDKNDQIPFLPLLPDLLFGYRDKLDDTNEFFAALYRHNFGMSKTKYDELTWKLRDNHRGLKHGSRPTSFYRGAPVAALMAVTFTFKKPTGTLATKELTNLGGWPPVTFLLPVLTPAGCEIDGYLSNPNLNRVIGQQPSIWSYKILNTKDQSIIPFGQPFTLTTVRAKGKDPDILRSLADVFKALWSQKAQYSALTTNVEHLDELGYGYATLNIDPMGQGRRIRGHNRYSGRFRVQDVRLLGEDLGNDAGMMDVHPDPSQVTKMLFRRQLRSQGEERHYRTIYMLPSFCKRMLEGNSTLPLLLTMHRHLLGDQRLTDFVDGRVHTRGDSFMNTLQANYGVGGVDEGQVGKIPTCRVPCALEFDPEGEPAVVGLSWSDEVMHDVQAAATPAEEVDIITTKTKKLTDFAHLDVLTSNSTSELTNTFGKVKKVEDDELVGADEDEGEGFIELFDSEEML
jgi:hypothetical protein